MYVSELQYLVLLALGAHSLVQIWKGICMKLVSAVEVGTDKSGEDWSVVGSTGDKDDKATSPEQAQHDEDWRALVNTIVDSRVKDLLVASTHIFRDYVRKAINCLFLLSSVLKMVFWPVLGVAFLISACNIWQDVSSKHLFLSRSHQEEVRFKQALWAYEALSDEASGTHWRKYPYYVDTVEFGGRYFVIHVTFWVCWHQVLTRVHHNDKIRGFESLLAALGKDWQFALFFIGSLLSSILLYFMLFHVWVETNSPFKVLVLNHSATNVEIEQAYHQRAPS